MCGPRPAEAKLGSRIRRWRRRFTIRPARGQHFVFARAGQQHQLDHIGRLPLRVRRKGSEQPVQLLSLSMGGTRLLVVLGDELERSPCSWRATRRANRR